MASENVQGQQKAFQNTQQYANSYVNKFSYYLVRCLAKCRQSSAVRGSQKILFLEAAKKLSRHIKPEQNRGENF